MVNLYTLPTSVIVLFIVVTLSLFLANSVLYYFLMPQAQFRQLGRKCLEGSSLVLLMAVASILYEVYTDSLSGIVYDEATDFWRYSTALAGTAGALYWIHARQAGSLWILVASILLMPVFDDWLPGSLVLALVCLAWRLIRLFPRTYNQYQQRLTARSIQTAVDCLDEGILISWEKGEPVLVNFTMYAVMEQLVGTVVRNANIFWHLLPFCGNRPGLSMERQGRDLLFRWDSGQAWLLQRRPIRFRRQSGWQITAANVTTLHRLNRELAQKNAVLEQRNEEMKEALNGLVALQTKQTTESLRYKIHDLLGQRITILQQLLNNPAVSDYGEILPLVEDVLSDLRHDAVANPQERLDALVTTYRNLGIAVTVEGMLPADTRRAGEFVRIIREAMTNALLHGQAQSIAVTFGTGRQPALVIADDGQGCPGPIQTGTGLQAMEQRVRALGGRLTLTKTPHFIIIEMAREAGADSFIYKESAARDFIDCLERTLAGEHLFPDVREKVTFGACHISLTDRELDILRLVCQNLSYQEIADELQISKRTVSFHISNMLSKTGHKSLIGLAVEAADKGYAPSRQK